VSDLGWFSAFALIFVLMAAVSGWIVWFSRHTMKSQKRQIDEMIREMRGVIDEDAVSDDEESLR
jgi:hypothetical protein